jgi:anti-anti-sigma regulatory factor
MTNETGPAGWAGPVTVVPFPEHLDASSAVTVSDLLRSLLGDGASALVADMSATSACDRAGLDALIVGRTPVQRAGGRGGRQRSGPTGGAA